MSNRTTSPSSLRPIRWASVPPIWPAPINAILGRAMWGRTSDGKRRKARQNGSETVSGLPFKSPADCSSRLYQALRRPRRDRMAVRQGEISLRAHLDQTRGRALELVRLEAFVGVIERVGLGLGGGDELDRMVVEGIDQDDEALSLVAPLIVHHRDMIEHDGVVLARDLEIVDGGQRLLAQIVKREARHSHDRARNANGASLYQQILRLPGVTRGEAAPGLIECSFRRT